MPNGMPASKMALETTAFEAKACTNCTAFKTGVSTELYVSLFRHSLNLSHADGHPTFCISASRFGGALRRRLACYGACAWCAPVQRNRPRGPDVIAVVVLHQPSGLPRSRLCVRAVFCVKKYFPG